MMNLFTVSLFGHRHPERAREVESRLWGLLRELFEKHEYPEFLIGRNGDFDLLAASVIRRAMQAYGRERGVLVLVLPYSTAEWQKDGQALLLYYDEVEIFAGANGTFYKAAIPARNRHMVDRSQLVVCWLEKESGGTFQTIRYAKKRGKDVLNLAVDE